VVAFIVCIPQKQGGGGVVAPMTESKLGPSMNGWMIEGMIG
jgi:hypothetical protein